MKSYGHTRHDKQTCRYGCCTLPKGNTHSDHRDSYDKRAAHRARQEAKKNLRQEDV